VFSTEHSGGRRFSVAVAVASAGGLDAFTTLLASLPHAFPIPIVVAQHLGPTQTSCFVDILQVRTGLRVCWARDGQPLEPSTVFIGPPGCHTLIAGNRLLITPVRERVLNGRPSGDLLLSSAALSYGSETLGIVLSGYLNDGARGAQIIRHVGGVVIVQDPCTAKVPEMPQASMNAGPVDFIVPLPLIPAALIALAMKPGAAELFCGQARAASN